MSKQKYKPTRKRITLMEEECRSRIEKEECAHVLCKDCKLNRRYKKFVGLGMDELAQARGTQ